MKLSRLLATLVVVLFIASIAASTVTSLAAQPKNTSKKEAKSVPGQILVRFKPSIATNAAANTQASDEAAASIGATVITRYALVPGLEVVKLPAGLSVTNAITYYKTNGNVAYAEPDYIASTDATATLPARPATNHSGYATAVNTPSLLPNDPYLSYQWALPDISAADAWTKTTGSPSTIIADVDIGIDATHPDLAANMLPVVNFAPDGYNTPDHPHGTHTAGIIGAVGNNSIGVAGTNWRTSILPIVAGNDSGLPYSAIISSWQYARDHGATIINNSFGGYSYSQAMKDAIDACPQCLFVCAAGNDANDNDGYSQHYPASFTSPNIISVAASDSDETLAWWSNYGATSVDLGAPGVNILSTIWIGSIGGIPGYDYMSGTSMATPYVTGVAGLIKTVNPSLSVAQIKNAILKNVDPDTYLTGEVLTGGRLDAAKAVNSVVGKNSTALTVTAPATASINTNFTVNGILSAGTTGIDSQTITLQRSTDAIVWNNVTTNVTNATGGYAFSKNETAVGTYNYRTSYDGNDANVNVMSNVVSVNVGSTQTALFPSNTTPTVGQSVTFIATLKSGTTPLSGKYVTIYHYFKGVKYIDTTKKTNASGQIARTQSFSSAGQRTYFATFAGDRQYAKSQAGSVTMTVRKAPTTTTLTASKTNPVVNQQVTFAAKLYWWNPTTSTWVALAGKPVTIWHTYNGVRYNDVTKTTSAGQVTLVQKFTARGVRYYHATFAGDASYTAASAVVTIIVH